MNTIIISALLGVILMLIGAFAPTNKNLPIYVAIGGAITTFALNFNELLTGQALFNFDYKSMLAFNSFNLTFIAVALFALIIFLFTSAAEVKNVGNNVAEYFALIFFITSGIAIIATFNTLLLLFVGIEIVSIPLYILTAADKRNLKSNEAGLKYFLMGAFSTGLMLMGIAFVFGGNPLGSFYIAELGVGTEKLNTFLTIGMVLLFIAMSFKVSAAPFHFWTPDVYDGAPTVFTSFMATIVKAAAFFAFLRLFDNAFGAAHSQWQKLVAVLIVATLLIGNLTAVFQTSVKRMLSYSSIAQAGFMLFAIFALNDKAKEGIILYSLGYSLATIGLFAILLKMKDYTVDGFNGLYKSQPTLAVCAVIFLLSLTGVPGTIGFLSKFYMLQAAMATKQMYWLPLFAVLCAAVSAYYYFKVIIAMFFKNNTNTTTAENIAITNPITTGLKLTLMVTAALIIIFGIAPNLVTVLTKVIP
jgi:NADH-quinone oxidoreductase subunit N